MWIVAAGSSLHSLRHRGARVADDDPQVGRYLVPLHLQMPQHLQPASPTGRQVEIHDENTSTSTDYFRSSSSNVYWIFIKAEQSNVFFVNHL